MRYWTLGVLGAAVVAAGVAVVSWSTYALTRASLCTPADTSFACERDTGQLGLAIAVALLLVIPIGSKLHARRKRPRGSVIGLLGWGLALTCAGGAAIASALGSGGDSRTAEAVGFGVGAALLSFGPLVLIWGLIAAGGRGDAMVARVEAIKAGAAPASAAATDPTDAMGRTPDPSRAQLGTLAAQLDQLAQARRRDKR